MIAVHFSKEELRKLLGLLSRIKNSSKDIIEGGDFSQLVYFIERLQYAEENTISVEKVAPVIPWKIAPEPPMAR